MTFRFLWFVYILTLRSIHTLFHRRYLYSCAFCLVCRGDEGISASHRAGCQRLPLHRLQAQEWTFWCDHCCFDQRNNRKGILCFTFSSHFIRKDEATSVCLKSLRLVAAAAFQIMDSKGQDSGSCKQLIIAEYFFKWHIGVCVFFFLTQGCHCLLDIAPHAIERLHSVHIYPIVVFVRYKNAKQIK